MTIIHTRKRARKHFEHKTASLCRLGAPDPAKNGCRVRKTVRGDKPAPLFPRTLAGAGRC